MWFAHIFWNFFNCLHRGATKKIVIIYISLQGKNITNWLITKLCCTDCTFVKLKCHSLINCVLKHNMNITKYIMNIIYYIINIILL